MADAAHKALSFGACEAIRSGAWDEHLHLIAHEIRSRQMHPDFRRTVLARAEIRAGVCHHDPMDLCSRCRP